MNEVSKRKILAMYDVRGIQNYIYRNPKIKDAMGASEIVRSIIGDTLREAVRKMQRTEPEITAALEWCDVNGPLSYADGQQNVEVLFVGGGNAYVTFSSERLCHRINCEMARLILIRTYSLQLAAAYVECTDSYAEDYRRLQSKMSSVKAAMRVTRPLGALPIMQIEIKSGFPLADRDGSTETILKNRAKERNVPKEGEEKILDNLAENKGENSILAVVHMDGNNMGLRIRQLIEGKETYAEAVTQMRKISYNISKAYEDTFEEVRKEIEKDRNRRFIRRIIVAGDDITYVCTASVALASVEMFCRKITELTMISRQNGKPSSDEKLQFGFSVCGGIAYMGSHFPFDIAYDVAESLCDSAKKEAKKPENLDNGRIGCYVDFQICKDVRCRDLDETRRREYTTAGGDSLLLRPYRIITMTDELGSRKPEKGALGQYDLLKAQLDFFQNSENLPRAFAKKIRNTYGDGREPMNVLASFLRSRGWRLPDKPDGGVMRTRDCMGEAFWKEEKRKDGTSFYRATFYDALELMDIAEKEQKDE